MHALIIEDNFLIATLIEEELRDLGYSSCKLCDSEEQAIASAVEQCPDLITADDKIVGSGVEAVRAICADRVVPVVFIVGSPQELKSPVPYSAMIAKPFGGRSVRQAVVEALKLAKAHGYHPPAMA